MLHVTKLQWKLAFKIEMDLFLKWLKNSTYFDLIQGLTVVPGN